MYFKKYLLFAFKIKVTISYFIHSNIIKIFDTKDVIIVNNKKIKSCYKRYIIYSNILFLSNICSYISDKNIFIISNIFNYINKIYEYSLHKLDIKFDKIKIIKLTNIGIKNIILDKYKTNTLKSVIDYLSYNKYNYPSGFKKTYMKFNIILNKKKFDIKKFMISYGDPNKLFNNSINNILIFEEPSYNFDNAVVEYTIFNKYPIKTSFSYYIIQYNHISDL